MYYYYDVLLNFGSDEEMYEFYEWDSEDTIEFIKKIPLFRVSTQTLIDQLKFKTTFTEEFLHQIENKTIVKSVNETLRYAFLISDAKNAIALELDTKGHVINRSKLMLNDEANLLEMLFTMRETTLVYEKGEKYKKRKNLRQVEEIKKLIKCEIDTLYESKNKSKLKYLYYEWFNVESDDINFMVRAMKNALKKEYDASFARIYGLIKLTYHKVN